MTRFLSRLCFVAVASVCLYAADAGARDDCILDNCADRADRVAPTRGASTGGAFDFYVLALSWSPGFCENQGGDRPQCEPGNHNGFVVHGLWPQYERGFPSDCDAARSPSRVALDQAKGLFPDEGLARHEWRKHGTCSGKSPSDYFADVARARALVTIPQPFVEPSGDQTFSPIDISRAFFAANGRLRPGMMAVGCRRGALEDVKICLSKDLREFRDCPEVVRRSCRTRELRVPAPM